MPAALTESPTLHADTLKVGMLCTIGGVCKALWLPVHVRSRLLHLLTRAGRHISFGIPSIQLSGRQQYVGCPVIRRIDLVTGAWP